MFPCYLQRHSFPSRHPTEESSSPRTTPTVFSEKIVPNDDKEGGFGWLLARSAHRNLLRVRWPVSQHCFFSSFYWSKRSKCRLSNGATPTMKRRPTGRGSNISIRAGKHSATISARLPSLLLTANCVPSIDDVAGWCRNKKYIEKVDSGFMCTVCRKIYGRYNSVSYHVTIYHRNPPIRSV